jgi:hypothetical protein
MARIRLGDCTAKPVDDNSVGGRLRYGQQSKRVNVGFAIVEIRRIGDQTR